LAARSLPVLIIILITLSLLGCSGQSNDHSANALIVTPHPTTNSEIASANTSLPSSQASPSVRVVVTVDFGQRLVLDKTVELTSKMSAMEALKRVAEVDMAYGGGFVNDINHARSEHDKGSGSDWFLSVNGIQSNTGALGYTLRPGDIENWDLHEWKFRQFIPARIGDFPEPFLHGYSGKVRPTIVVYENTFREDAIRIVECLTLLGTENVSTKPVDELSKEEKGSCNLILLGDMGSSLVTELNKLWERMGFFAHFNGGKLIIFDANGHERAEFNAGSGLIQATQNPWNSRGIGAGENVVWMVTGTDENGVRSAVDVLVDRYEEFEWAYGVVISGSTLIKLPQVE
jgi:hypothetical protein